MQTVIETPDYVGDARRAELTEEERFQIITHLAGHPDAGAAIPGAGGARKVRFAGRGKGKSGGYRVITFYAGEAIPVFLLNVFAKGDRVDLSQSERNQLKAVLRRLAAAYTKGVKEHVEGRKKNS